MMTQTKRESNKGVGLVIINVCQYRRPGGGDPGFLDRGFKFIKGGGGGGWGSIC